MKTRVIIVLGLVAIFAVAGCKKKKKDEAKAGDTMEAMDMEAMDMEAMDMEAMGMDAMDMDAMEAMAAPEKPKKTGFAKALDDAKSPKAAVRAAAMKALGMSRKPEAVPVLIASLKDPDLKVRLLAATWLEDFKSPEAVKPLVEFWNDPTLAKQGAFDQSLVRQAIIRAVAKAATPEAFKALRKWSRYKKDKSLAKQAKEALKKARKARKARKKAK